MKKIIIIIAAIAVTFAGLVLTSGIYRLNPTGENIRLENGDSLTVKGATYIVEGVPVTLKTPGTAYFGNDAKGDINGDGIDDVVFLLTEEPGGSGTFYYVAAAIKTASGYKGTNAVFVGDRIAPQTTEIKNQEIIVQYADRGPEDTMSTKPSIGMSLHLHFEAEQLVATEIR